MIWIALLLIHLVGLVGYSLLLRKAVVVGKLHPWVLATLLQTGIMVPMLLAAPFLPIDIGRISVLDAAVMAVVVALGIFLLIGITKALQYLEAGTFSVVYSLRIILVTLLAAVLLSELPSLIQIAGGLLILAATFVVRQKGGKKITRRGILWGLATVVAISILGIAEKYLVNEVGVFTAAPIVTLTVGLIMWTILLVKRYAMPKKYIFTSPVIWLMVFRSLSNWGFVFALAAGAFVSVATFVSSLSVVLIVGLGALLLGEKSYMHRKIIATALAVIGAVAVLFGSSLWPLVQPNSINSTPAAVITHSTDKPDEVKPGKEYVWRGTASDPKKIVMPTIGVDAYLQNVGVDQHKEVAVPSNIHMGGWFVDSVRPGDMGLSIIDGHLNGPRRDGIFINLEQVKIGDVYSIEFGDGSKREFKVRTVQVVDLDKAAGILFSQDPSIANQLTLVTCGGEYDRQARLYDKRVVVVSELVN